MGALKTYIVEDSAIIRENLVETLRENAPIDVVGSAADETTASAWLRDDANACDLVIIDIFLRAGTGLGVLKAMAGSDGQPLRVVLSNHATPEIRAKCTELGAVKVFDKSNEIEEMLAWLNRLTQRNDRAEPALRP